MESEIPEFVDFLLEASGSPGGLVGSSPSTGIPVGINTLATIQLATPVEDNFLCLELISLTDTSGSAIETNVICGGNGIVADVIYSITTVDVNGIVQVSIQSSVEVSGFQFDVINTGGNPVEVVTIQNGLAGMSRSDHDLEFCAINHKGFVVCFFFGL